MTLIPGGFVFAGGATVVAYNNAGTQLWSTTVAGVVKNSLAYNPITGLLYFGTEGAPGHFYGLRAADGGIAVDFVPADSGISFDISSAAIDAAGNVYIGSFNGRLIKFV